MIRVLLLWLMLLPVPAMAAPEFPKLSGRVIDAAGLLSPEQKVQLEALSASVQQASTRQLVVATIPDLQGYDIADYGYQLGRAWGIGQKDANNGILLIVAPKDRKVRIEVGYGLEPIMTDALSNRIIQEQILPRFRDKDMPGGIIAGANAIAEQLKLPLEAAEQRAKEAQPPPRPKGGGFPLGLIFFLIILVFVIVPMIAAGARGRRYRGNGGGGAMPVVLWSIANEIGRQSRHSSNSSWSGGSSWGGGGGSWGGGGGGFSGGGGSFGGGGASGSW